MKKEKVGILNYQYSDHNYGAVLQAAALENIIHELGYSPEHIDYAPYNKNSIQYKIKHGFLGHLIKSALGKRKLFNYVTNKSVFEDFRLKWLNRTNEVYLTSQDLNKIKENYSAIVVGSDQVWRYNMHISSYDSYAYFLQFASEKTIKISYAASFGVDYWEKTPDDEITKKISHSLAKFNAISVREDSGVNICRNVFNVNAKHVLDPTLLAGNDFFEKIIESNNHSDSRNDSLVYYKLDTTDDFKLKMKNISSKLNLETENIYFHERMLSNKYISVSSWLEKIKLSKLVITDSFHCVCFSIIFNKDFICIKNKNRGESRLYSLLNSLGLQDRFIDLDQLSYYIENNEYKINYGVVNPILDNLRIESLNFLKNALSNINHVKENS